MKGQKCQLRNLEGAAGPAHSLTSVGLPSAFVPEPLQSFAPPQDLCTHIGVVLLLGPSLLHLALPCYPLKGHTSWHFLRESLPALPGEVQFPLMGWFLLLTYSERICSCLTFPPNHGLHQDGPVLLNTASKA